MSSWSNIQIAANDPEITRIDNWEHNLGKLPEQIIQIRELVTRFEVCHFKYQEHIAYIKNSISELYPKVVPSQIGVNHIQHGEKAWKNDSTGRSFIGQQYLWAIKQWLDTDMQNNISEYSNNALAQKIINWLGDKYPTKSQLVRFLLARLTWDWKSCGEFEQGGELKEIEYQASRIDICHYAFPNNLDQFLQAIGKMKSVEKFEGCGSYNKSIKSNIKNQFLILNDMLLSSSEIKSLDKKDQTKMWLIACLAKTLKEQIDLKDPIAINT